MKPAWIKATEAWQAEGNYWRTVNYLIASERIAAGKNLRSRARRPSCWACSITVRDTVPKNLIAVVCRCAVIGEPVIEWRSAGEAMYFGSDAKSFSVRQEDRTCFYCSVSSAGRTCKEMGDIADHLWRILGQHLEKCHFDFQGGIYVELTGEELEAEIEVQRR